MKVVIVGGVAGGASAAARLRRIDENCEIILFEKGEHISFANCGLPYYIGEVIKEKEKLLVQTPEAMKKRFNIDVRVKSEVIGIDTNKKQIKVIDEKNNKEYLESYDKLILSPGAAPIKPNIQGIAAPNVFTLRNIPDTYAIKDYVDNKKPQNAVVIGGGFIGIEIAENLRERGVSVSLVELADQVMGPIDYEMAAIVQNHMECKGVKLFLGDGLKAIHHVPDYSEVELNSGKRIKADMVVLGIGVRPEVALAKGANLELGERGGIKVDKNLRTSNPDIYAVGDAIEVIDYINGKPTLIPLAGPANKQGRIAANNICGANEEYEGTQGTSVLKVFDLTVASTGNNEKLLKRFNIPYMKSYTHSASHASYYPDSTIISIKLLFSPEDGKVLGAQAVGFDGVEKRIDVIATAIRAGMTVHDLEKLELSYAPPYSSAKDPVNMAGYTAANLLKGHWKAIYWDEINKLDKEKSVLIDVRMPMEFEAGTIEGAVNIPLDEIRRRIDEFPRDKEIIIFCQVGLRGYIASRILTQRGYTDVRNLSGGYRTYAAVYKSTPVKHDKVDNNGLAYAALQDKGCGCGTPAVDVKLDACGLQCPGPIMKVNNELKEMRPGQILEVTATDPAFARDVESWCRRTGNEFVNSKFEGRKVKVFIKKGGDEEEKKTNNMVRGGNDKTMVVFSGDLDKAIASFIIANGAAAMGRKVTMFFTFWGLNILRKHDKVKVKKGFLETMFGKMMPRGTRKLALSKMNMAGMGAGMIKYIMKKKNVLSLDELIEQAKAQGVHLVACSMSMDIMGIKEDELIDGVEIGGVASYLAAAETGDTNLFI